MRRVIPNHSLLGTSFQRSLSLSLSIWLGVFHALPALAGDDRYAYNSNSYQDFSNRYQPNRTYSNNSPLDRQIRIQNAALSFRYQPAVYSPKVQTKLDLPALKAIPATFKFEPATLNKVQQLPQAIKIAPRPADIANGQKRTFLSSVGGVAKAIGRTIAMPFQKLGQAIANLVQRAFQTNKTPVLTESQKVTLGAYQNLQPTTDGNLTASGGQTVALGRVWEQGSTFKLSGDKLELIQGTTMERTFGGLQRKDGGDIPILMSGVSGKIEPTGIDLGRLPAKTVLSVSQPLAIQGFGEIKAGEMTFQGAWKSPDGQVTGGRFTFQNTLLDLNKDLAHGLGMENPVVIRQADLTLKAGIMRFQGVEIESKGKRLYLQENRAPIDVNALQTQVEGLKAATSEAQQLGSKAEEKYSHAAVASRSLLTYITAGTGQSDAMALAPSDELRVLREEHNSLAAQVKDVDRGMKGGDFQKVSDSLPKAAESLAAHSAKAEQLAHKAEMMASFFREVQDLDKDLATAGRFIDAGDFKKGIPTQEQIAEGYGHFPSPYKNIFSNTASHAQKTLVKLVNAGALDPDTALDWAIALKIAKDKVLAAGPAKLTDHLKVAAKYPQATITQATSEAADLYVFDHLTSFGESNPTAGVVIGTTGYYLSKTANLFGKAAGIGILVTFPVSSGAAFITNAGVDYGLQKAGVNPDLAGFVGIVAGLAAGSGVGKTVKVARFEKAWATRIGSFDPISQVYIDFKDGFRSVFRIASQSPAGQAGHMYVGTPDTAIESLPASKIIEGLPETLPRTPGMRTSDELSRSIKFESPEKAAIGWREYQRAFTRGDLMVIGAKEDAMIAEKWPRHQILNIPDSEWSLTVNDAWVQGGMDRRATFYLGSPKNDATMLRSWGESIYAREMKQLKNGGYRQIGDLFVPSEP